MSSKKRTTAKQKDAKPALVPKLRFPEFRGAHGWEIEPLGQLADYQNGKAYEQYISENGKFVVVNSRFISTDGAVRKYTNADFLIAKSGEVLMVLSDLPNGRALAKCYYVEVDERYAVNQRVCQLRPKRIEGKFLYVYVESASEPLSVRRWFKPNTSQQSRGRRMRAVCSVTK